MSFCAISPRPDAKGAFISSARLGELSNFSPKMIQVQLTCIRSPVRSWPVHFAPDADIYR